MNFFVETKYDKHDYEYIESKYEYQTDGNCYLSEDDFYICLSNSIKNIDNIDLIIPYEILDKSANEYIGLTMWL